MKEVYAVTMLEQETTIRIGRADELAYLDTTDSTMITKVNKLLETEGTQWKLIKDDGVGIRATFPKNLVTLRAKTIERKKMTEEEKKAFADRMQKYR